MTVLFDNTLTRKEKLSSEYLLDTNNSMPFMATVRKTLEEWFTHYPQEQKKEFLSRCRDDNASYRGALLELATHEILRKCAGKVLVEDALPNRKRPDFHVCTPEGRQLWVECSVAQRSDEFKGAIATARRLRDVVNSMDTRPFGLSWMLLGHSSDADPRESRLKREIEQFVRGLSSSEFCLSGQEGKRVGQFDWEDRGWRVRFGAYYLPGLDDDAPTIVSNQGENAGVNDENEGWEGNDIQKLRQTLEKKAGQLKSANGSCVIVISHSELILDNTGRVLASALLLHPDSYDGSRPFYGSADSPRNQHVTGVLYKPWVKAHMFCSRETPWCYVPHPWSLSPLNEEIFPFAFQGGFNGGGAFKWSAPKCTPNQYLGLLDDWPGSPKLLFRTPEKAVTQC